MTIAVAAKSGVTATKLVSGLQSLVPANARVRTGAAEAAKAENDLAGFVKYIRYFRVGVGLVALFVGGFVIFSLLGAALGLPVGVALAALATRGLHGYGLTLSVPVPSLAIFVLLSLSVGVIAAVLPARRAGKLNVLAALSYE